MKPALHHFYCRPQEVRFSARNRRIEQRISSLLFPDKSTASASPADLFIVDCEHCFYVLVNGTLAAEERKKLFYLLKPLDGGGDVSVTPTLTKEFGDDDDEAVFMIEVGPRPTFTTAFSTNAVAACLAAGLERVERIERSARYSIKLGKPAAEKLAEEKKRQVLFDAIADCLHDRMTECLYERPAVDFFLSESKRRQVSTIDLMSAADEEEALRRLANWNASLGLALDESDLRYYCQLYLKQIRRNPTDVELIDLGQSNSVILQLCECCSRFASFSEHSRHWFFKGRLLLDGVEQEQSLMEMIADTQKASNDNNVIKFCDNSSGIEGFDLWNLLQNRNSSKYNDFPLSVSRSKRHIIYTAETHNFPTAVCPFAGATTGTGGRIRDVQAAGRGAHPIAAVAGYSFGRLDLPGAANWPHSYPANFALPVQVAIDASNGASDYGNKFGEPVLAGFARSFAVILTGGQRWEYVKPIMFSGGLGSIDDAQIHKVPAEKGQLVVKIGGPVYPIGVGGGSASSLAIQGSSCSVRQQLDYGAVQRGDAEMEQKMNRVIRSCIECGSENPILAIHDQGAGGNGNVLKELVEGAGAEIDCSRFGLGDPTVGARELWVAEYQESNAVLVHPQSVSLLEDICRRERCPLTVVGSVTGDNRMVLRDFAGDGNESKQTAVDLPLDLVLGNVPRKSVGEDGKPLVQMFELSSSADELQPNTDLIRMPTVEEALERVLRLPSVASKRYLTAKVDRSVTGLVAQQQCVGPLHTPVADVAVTALSFFSKFNFKPFWVTRR